ncbi:MAG: glycosyltransferase, partial [Lachnospiraceae bacterium]|nr:glycosyltransferase [Lachnospiraceae bacterium]
GAKEFQLDYYKTLRNCTLAHLDEVIKSDAKKFITVGRFSEEKGHERLIDAFAKVLKDYPDTYLFIVGGYGKLFEPIKKKVKDMGLTDNVIVIRYLSNPYPLVKLCDYFALSSYYEGFGLVLAEADILGVPCFSTEITGPTQFMKEHGGMLVENSEKGIENGLRACLEGKVPKKLDIDYEEYNKEALKQFEALL